MYRIKATDTAGQPAWLYRNERGRLEWVRDRERAAMFSLHESTEVMRKMRRTLVDWTIAREEVE